MQSTAALIPLLAPDFEPVLTADPVDGQSDDLRFAELARYIEALSRPDDHPLGGGAFTWQWSERELSTVYGVAATLLDVEVSNVRVRVGVDRGSGTRHFRSSSLCLVVHDLYDRMFVELMRVVAQVVIESDDREAAGSADSMASAITASVVAGSFARELISGCVHAQLLGNLEMVGFQSTLTRSRIASERRSGAGFLPSIQMSLISDLVMALHELSHLHVRSAPPDAEELVSMLASFAVKTLGLFAEMVPGTQDVISFLTSAQKLKGAAVLAVTIESEVDGLALSCLENTGLYQWIDARTTACVLFGVTLLEFCRKAGSLLADGPDAREGVVEAKALAVLRLSNAVADILNAQDPAQESAVKDQAFMQALLCYLLEATGRVESVFIGGLRGTVVNSLSARANRLMDRYEPREDMRTGRDGSVQLAEIETWAADELLRNWVDYSKPYRAAPEGECIYLRDELSAAQ